MCIFQVKVSAERPIVYPTGVAVAVLIEDVCIDESAFERCPNALQSTSVAAAKGFWCNEVVWALHTSFSPDEVDAHLAQVFAVRFDDFVSFFLFHLFDRAVLLTLCRLFRLFLGFFEVQCFEIILR